MNNVAILTAGNAVYSQKRARKRARIEELTFNPESRRYVAGFITFDKKGLLDWISKAEDPTATEGSRVCSGTSPEGAH